MDLECSLVQKVSKSGREYLAIVVKLAPGYEKIVYLEKSEQALIKVVNGLS